MTDELRTEKVLNRIWGNIEKLKAEAIELQKNRAYIKGLEHARRIVECEIHMLNGDGE